jgi:hypothetical protein
MLPGKESFIPSQRGAFDDNILCAKCDNFLGQFESYAGEVLQTVRRATAQSEFGVQFVDEIDGDRFLRFCAGLVWKFSVAKFGRISLGPYQSALQRLAFIADSAIPSSIDAAIIRLRVREGDTEVFGYRMPLYDRKKQINFCRFMVGGCVMFVKLDKRPISEPNFSKCSVRGGRGVYVGVAPAQLFDEYREFAKTVERYPNLSQFLDKQADRAKRGR